MTLSSLSTNVNAINGIYSLKLMQGYGVKIELSTNRLRVKRNTSSFGN
nr:MAG TPA: hypothetical protein [Caudoviricetes sp.]